MTDEAIDIPRVTYVTQEEFEEFKQSVYTSMRELATGFNDMHATADDLLSTIEVQQRTIGIMLDLIERNQAEIARLAQKESE